MKKNGNELLNSATRFAPVSIEEQLQVEGGLSWSGLWDAVKDAANWVKDNVFIDLGNRVFGWKGTW